MPDERRITHPHLGVKPYRPLIDVLRDNTKAKLNVVLNDAKKRLQERALAASNIPQTFCEVVLGPDEIKQIDEFILWLRVECGFEKIKQQDINEGRIAIRVDW